MPPSVSEEASLDEVLVPLRRRSRPSRYSVHNGVARNPDGVEYDGLAAQPSERSRRRHRQPADVAQSVVFEAILLSEIDELEDRAAAVERRWHRRRGLDEDAAVTLPHDLTELRQRITEAQRMLDAMRTRFHSR